MTKTTKAAAAAPDETVPVVSEDRLSLDEFCIRRSAQDKRVELIGAFERAERRAGRLTDAAAAYAARFQAFINKPA